MISLCPVFFQGIDFLDSLKTYNEVMLLTVCFRFVVFICHGLHEYMGRYELLAQQLKENGALVRGLDLGNE